MTELKSHVPGSFCWPELVTTDRPGAVAFYRGLFGWEVDEQPTGPGEIYSTFQMRGYRRAHPERTGGTDQSAKKATQLRGRVQTGPQDIPNVGRFAMLGDPVDAGFAVFTRAGK
jgi:predicted enzyme related to lactoylglutathione lyase